MTALIVVVLLVAGAIAVRRRLLAIALRIPQPKNGWRRKWTQVATSEGHQLSTQILTPTSEGPHPTVLVRTPYGQGWRGGPVGVVNQLFAELLVERGFIVVQQDVRGRFKSTGEFAAFQHEREDGLATLDWLERQAWFNGRLGLFGQSYGGFVQWAIADDERVACMVPIQTSARLGALTHDEGTIAIDTALRFLCMMAIFGVKGAPNVLKASWMMLKQTAVVRPPAMTLPLLDTDRALIGREEAGYREALQASGDGHPYWARVDQTESRDRSKAPALFITGWLDPFLRETIEDFQAVSRDREAWLTCGVWPHGAINGVWLREVFTFLNHHLKGGPPLKRLPVRYANMTTKRWTQEDAWPPAHVEERTFFAHAGGRLSADPPTSATSPTEYVFDPADPTPHVGGPLLDLEGAGLLDNAELETRADVVTFTSAPLDRPLVLAGAARVHLAAASSAPTTDFFLRLNHVHPDGRSTNVTDRFVRLGHGQLPVDDTFELFPIVYLFNKGDQLRLLIASGAHPRYARNHGTGEPQATATEFVVQEQRVFHELDRQTSISLPVVASR